MALSSKLFRGNRALQACALEDSAHVTRGASGDHVGKIQFALFALDRAPIERSELVSQLYGRSTAAAVLAYKKRRQIINTTYQSAADDIVGKMTIASLDKEMRLRELVPSIPGDCVLSPDGSPPPVLSFVGSKTGKTVAPQKPQQLTGVVRVFFQITLKAATEDGYPLSASIERARDCLFEHGITLVVEVRNGFADTLRFSEPISSGEGEVNNLEQLRKASEDARPGMRGILRVIVGQMVGDHRGDTFRNRFVGGLIVPPFVVLNSQLVDRQSNATLIHEMIHASKDGPFPHDSEPNSVFFEPDGKSNADRTTLRAEHAATLSRISSKL